MPKRRRPRKDVGRPGVTNPIPAPEGWSARVVAAAIDGPDYTCPRCFRPVPRRTQHVVAAPTDGEHHRHWHRGCWEAAVREGLDRYRFE